MEKTKWILTFKLFILNQHKTNHSDSISRSFDAKVDLSAVSIMLLDKDEKILRKASERFCSQMLDSSSCLQAVHCCSMCVSSPIGSWIIQTILVQEQPLIRPVLLPCPKAFSLTPLIGHPRFGAQKGTQEVGADGNVHLMSQRSPGVHRGLSGGWCCSLFTSGHLGSGAPMCLPERLHLPCHCVRPRTYTAWSEFSTSMPFKDSSVIQVLQWWEECWCVFSSVTSKSYI